MVEALIADWLEEYSTITSEEMTTFAAQHQHNHEVAAAVFAVFHNHAKYSDLIEQVCVQLFSFYRSAYNDLKLFAVQFLPTLIYLYLNAVVQGEKKRCHSVETFLISVYNLEILDENGQPRVISFRMPFLAQHSIYHEAKGLAQTDLRRWEECSAKMVNWGPLPHVEILYAQNRVKVMTALLFVYNRYLSLLPKASLHHLCKAATVLTTQGFPRTHCSSQKTKNTSFTTNNGSFPVNKSSPRIPLSGQFLLELLHAVYFAMFNEFASMATSTVEDIHRRAVFELYSDVILVTNAIKHSLADNPSGQPCDGPMGISVAISPASTTVTVSKSMITNASFRTKKLPDDIPIQISSKDDQPSAGDGLKNLLAISEENDELTSNNMAAAAASIVTDNSNNSNNDKAIGARTGSLRGAKDGNPNQSSGGKGLPKLPAFPGLSKKTKDIKHVLKNGSSEKNMNNTSMSSSSIEMRKISNKNENSKLISRASLHLTNTSGDGDSSTNKDSCSLLSRKKSSSMDTHNNGPLENGLMINQFRDENEKVSLISGQRDSIRIPLRDEGEHDEDIEDEDEVLTSNTILSSVLTSSDGKSKLQVSQV